MAFWRMLVLAAAALGAVPLQTEGANEVLLPGERFLDGHVDVGALT